MKPNTTFLMQLVRGMLFLQGQPFRSYWISVHMLHYIKVQTLCKWTRTLQLPHPTNSSVGINAKILSSSTSEHTKYICIYCLLLPSRAACTIILPTCAWSSGLITTDRPQVQCIHNGTFAVKMVQKSQNRSKYPVYGRNCDCNSHRCPKPRKCMKTNLVDLYSWLLVPLDVHVYPFFTVRHPVLHTGVSDTWLPAEDGRSMQNSPGERHVQANFCALCCIQMYFHDS